MCAEAANRVESGKLCLKETERETLVVGQRPISPWEANPRIEVSPRNKENSDRQFYPRVAIAERKGKLDERLKFPGSRNQGESRGAVTMNVPVGMQCAKSARTVFTKMREKNEKA
jgi:hypothetical protein